MSRHVAKLKPVRAHITPKWCERVNRLKVQKLHATMPHIHRTEKRKFPLREMVEGQMVGRWIRIPLPVSNCCIWMFERDGDYRRFLWHCVDGVKHSAITIDQLAT